MYETKLRGMAEYSNPLPPPPRAGAEQRDEDDHGVGHGLRNDDFRKIVMETPRGGHGENDDKNKRKSHYWHEFLKFSV